MCTHFVQYSICIIVEFKSTRVLDKSFDVLLNDFSLYYYLPLPTKLPEFINIYGIVDCERRLGH